MLLCDDEPSPVSSDEVFFICEKQTKIDPDDSRSDNCQDEQSDSDDLDDTKKTTRSSRKKIIDTSNDSDDKTKKSVKEAESQTAHTILVKIQVENCSQCPNDKSISLFSHETPGGNKDNNPCKKKKTVAVQVNFNSIESVVESHCVKISKVRCCNKASLLQNVAKTAKKCNTESTIEKVEGNKSGDSTKIYMWSGKSAKKKASLKSVASLEKPKAPPTIQEPPVPRRGNVEKASSLKCKKPPACSPLKKLNRSSLTIEPDKITINLSKYSPCASRLAASSKILSSNSPLSPDSPLHGVSRSPRRIEHVQSVDGGSKKQSEKMTLQASLSLNIQQYQKSHPTPRSRSVGDSCVTSPTSEATTLSYSPTGTEILSLEEVGNNQSSLNEAAASSIFVLPPPEIKDKLSDDYSVCLRKANLETKC